MKDSLYVKFDDGRVVELAVYEKTDVFPHPTKYVTVVTAAGRHGYLPLDELGGEYDSGLRFTETATGDVYQVCTRAATNVVNTYLHVNNYFAPLTPTTAYDSLRAVFEDRVSVDGEYVYLRSPGVTSGVAKMLVAGDGVEVNYDEVTYSLSANGGRSGSTGDRAFLVKFQHGKVYRFKVTGDACVVIGQDVDALPDSSSGFSSIVNLVNVCSVDANNRVSASDQTALANVAAAKATLSVNQRYSYYVLTNEVYRSTAVDVE